MSLETKILGAAVALGLFSAACSAPVDGTTPSPEATLKPTPIPTELTGQSYKLRRYHRDSFELQAENVGAFNSAQRAAVNMLADRFHCKWIGTGNTGMSHTGIIIVEDGFCVPTTILAELK